MESEHRTPGAGGALAHFDSLAESEWVTWLDGFLGGGPCTPPLPLAGREPDEALRHLAERLPSDAARTRFGRALAELFEATPSSERNAARLYYLLHVMAPLRPAAAKAIVRQRVFEHSLEGLHFAMQDLQALAFVVAAKYAMDDALAHFAEMCAARGVSFSFRIAALQMLALRNDGRAAAYLRHFLPDLREGGNAKVLERAIETVVWRVGYREIQGWYHHQAKSLWWERPEDAATLAAVLERTIERRGVGDVFALALREEIASRRELPAAAPVFRLIAEEPALGPDMTLDVLRRVYENARALGRGVPWTFGGEPAFASRSGVFPIRRRQNAAQTVFVYFGREPGDGRELLASSREVELLQAAEPDAPPTTEWSDIAAVILPAVGGTGTWPVTRVVPNA